MTIQAADTADVIVIGGGIHGASTALHLARRGRAVILLERDRLGRHASGVNAGSVHHIPRIHFELPLAEIALSTWPRIADLVDDDCGYHQNGFLRIAECEQDIQTAHDAMGRVRRLSKIKEVWLERDDLHALQPGLGESLSGAIWAPECGSADPARTLHAFRRSLLHEAVVVHEGCHIQSVARNNKTWECRSATQTFKAATLVNCAGGWGADVAALAGERFILNRQALMMSVTAREPARLGPVIGHVGRRLSIKQAPNGTYLIGGGYRGMLAETALFAGLNRARLAYNLALAQHVFLPLAQCVLSRCWAGIEGFAPDHAAYVGPSAQHEGLWHCFGFSAHGFYLGPVVAPLLAEAIDTGILPDLLYPFHPSRSSRIETRMEP